MRLPWGLIETSVDWVLGRQRLGERVDARAGPLVPPLNLLPDPRREGERGEAVAVLVALILPGGAVGCVTTIVRQDVGGDCGPRAARPAVLARRAPRTHEPDPHRQAGLHGAAQVDPRQVEELARVAEVVAGHPRHPHQRAGVGAFRPCAGGAVLEERALGDEAAGADVDVEGRADGQRRCTKRGRGAQCRRRARRRRSLRRRRCRR